MKLKQVCHYSTYFVLLFIASLMDINTSYAQDYDEYESYVKVPKRIVHFGIEYPISTKTMGYNNQNIKLDQGVNFGMGVEFKVAKLQYVNCVLLYYSDNLSAEGIYENETLTKWQSFIIGVDSKWLLRKPTDFFVPYGFIGFGVDINSQEYTINNSNKNLGTSTINKYANGGILRLGIGFQYSNKYMTIETDIRLHYSFFELSRRNKDYTSFIYGLRVGYNM